SWSGHATGLRRANRRFQKEREGNKMEAAVPMRTRTLVLAVASIFSVWAWPGQSALAQATAGPGPAGTPATLGTITVTAERETAITTLSGYIPKLAATANKTDTPLLETPQAITVVTRDEKRDQGAQNIQDALNYAAGVRSDAYVLDSRAD